MKSASALCDVTDMDIFFQRQKQFLRPMHIVVAASTRKQGPEKKARKPDRRGRLVSMIKKLADYFFAAQGFLAAQGFSAPFLLWAAVLLFFAFSLFLSFSAQGFFAAQGFLVALYFV